MDKIGIIGAKWSMLKKSLSIIKKIGKLRNSIDPDMIEDIVAQTGLEMDQVFDNLETREQIAQNMGTFTHSEYGKNITSLTDNGDLLEGLLQALMYENPELKEDVIDTILAIEGEHDFYDDKVHAIISYFQDKKYCVFQDVIGVVDENFGAISDEEWCVEALDDVIEGYTEENMSLPFEETTIKRIMSNLDFVDEADFKHKDKKSFINLVNGIFQSYCEFMPQIELEDGKVKGKMIAPFGK